MAVTDHAWDAVLLYLKQRSQAKLTQTEPISANQEDSVSAAAAASGDTDLNDGTGGFLPLVITPV